MRIIGILFIVLFTALPSAGASLTDAYLRAAAQPGDGVYSLLRRYQLDSYRCNFDKFYSLNNMSANSRLRVGQEYQLPIAIYEFDGRTIRSTIGNDDWNTAVSIRDYNREMTSQGITNGAYEETLELWVPHHLVSCEGEAAQETVTTTDIPSATVVENAPTSGRRVFPIFGTNYAYTPLASTRLQGKVFYVVSGHGGPDPGAMGTRGDYTLCEDEYAYDVALRLCRNLIAHGATAYMVIRDPDDGIRDEEFLSCDNDEIVWGGIQQSRHQKTRLTQRSDAINTLYERHEQQGVTEQTMIAVHVDSRSRSERTDLFFYHHPSSSEGRQLAQRMHRTMRQKYRRYRANGAYHGTVTGRDLHMLRECLPTSVYIELANIRNIHDQQRIIIERNRQLLADWILEGILSN